MASCLSKVIKIYYQSESARDKLMSAVENNNPVKCMKLLRAGVDPNFVQNTDRSPLIVASHRGYVHIVKTLIDREADVNLQDRDGSTPLSTASRSEHLEIVKILIEAGADVNLQDRFGRTPLSKTSYYGHVEVVKILIEAGADVNRGTPLLTAISRLRNLSDIDLQLIQESQDIIISKALLEAGANINAVDKDGNTALMRLILSSSDFESQSHYERTRRELWREFMERANFLVTAGADLDVGNNVGQTALMLMINMEVRNRWRAISAMILVRAGADINTEDNSGNNAIFHALHSGLVVFAKLLTRLSLDENPSIRGVKKILSLWSKWREEKFIRLQFSLECWEQLSLTQDRLNEAEENL